MKKIFISIIFCFCSLLFFSEVPVGEDSDAKNWNIAILDTARDVKYLSPIEKDVILEMNKVRTDPKKYAELYISPRLKFFDGDLYKVPGEITLQTNEGKAALEECIKDLSSINSAPILVPELGLSLGAKDHTVDQGKRGATGHTGSDGSSPSVRVNRYGKWQSKVAENISYGEKSGRNIVVQLLIDDGVPSRGHRVNIMNRDFTKTGVSYGTHPKYDSMCTITYAAKYTSN